LAGDRQTPKKRKTMNAQRVKVLLVEDNPSDALLIRESLAEATDDHFDLETLDTLAAGLQRLSSAV